MAFNQYTRDIVEEAQQVMNANKSLDNKNLISALANEIIACRAEIERLEKKCLSNAQLRGLIKKITVGFDHDGKVDCVETERYE